MTAELSVRAVYAAMSVRAHTRTSSENVADVLEALAALRPSAAPAAREVELPKLPSKPMFQMGAWGRGDYSAADMKAYATTALQSAASGREDSAMLDWLLSHPNEVFEEAGNEWFVLDADSTPTYFKSDREALRAAMNTTKGAEQ
jgi:hypothetical protein